MGFSKARHHKGLPLLLPDARQAGERHVEGPGFLTVPSPIILAGRLQLLSENVLQGRDANRRDGGVEHLLLGVLHTHGAEDRVGPLPMARRIPPPIRKEG